MNHLLERGGDQMHCTCQIGRIIRSYRQKSNLTIEKVAELCDMSVRGYIKIELGDSDPKWNTLSKIITVLEVEPDEPYECAALIYDKSRQ